MEKVFKVADIRKLEQQVTKGDISYSRMVELINEMAHTHYIVNKSYNLQSVNGSALDADYWSKRCEIVESIWENSNVTCRKFWVRYKYRRLMAKLLKSYWHTCNEMAFLQDKAPKRLRLKWAFQQRRIKLYKRYLSIYGR